MSDSGLLSRAGSKFHRLYKNSDKVMTADTSKRYRDDVGFAFRVWLTQSNKEELPARTHRDEFFPLYSLDHCSHMGHTQSKSNICLMFLIISIFGYKFSRPAKLPWSNSGPALSP